jgi:hypothetical protein
MTSKERDAWFRLAQARREIGSILLGTSRKSISKAIDRSQKAEVDLTRMGICPFTGKRRPKK